MATGATAAAAPAHPVHYSAPASNTHMNINCEYYAGCPEVADSKAAFGSEYVGHDEPATVFYSNQPGSGNRNFYDVLLPHDPSPSNPTTKSYQFELNPAIWVGMVLCDTQSYPEQTSTCTPDSDTNIPNPAVSPNFPGSAYMPPPATAGH